MMHIRLGKEKDLEKTIMLEMELSALQHGAFSIPLLQELYYEGPLSRPEDIM
jgi:hypothetical protein